jgi:hypothetical protein
MPGALPVEVRYALPSSSKKRLGSIPPGPVIQIGYDQGPAGSVAVTKNVPRFETLVVIM